jgi:hypothetical protein
MSNMKVVMSELLIEYGMKCASIYNIFSVHVEYDYLPVRNRSSFLSSILDFK